MTSTTLPPYLITVRLTTSTTAHRSLDASQVTLCGRPVVAWQWTRVTALSGPHRMVGHGPSFLLQPCQRCAAKLAKIVAADHVAAIAEDATHGTRIDREYPWAHDEARAEDSLRTAYVPDSRPWARELDGDSPADYVAPLPDAFAAGQRVGIVRGLQSVNGPRVYRYGTVVRSVELWRDTVEYVVRHDDDGAELVYRAYLLRPAPETANSIGHRAVHASRVGAPLPRIRFADGRERQVRDARFGPTHTVLVYAEPHPSSDVFRHDAMITVI
jgi:hypothetical protein